MSSLARDETASHAASSFRQTQLSILLSSHTPSSIMSLILWTTTIGFAGLKVQACLAACVALVLVMIGRRATALTLTLGHGNKRSKRQGT